ncbi:zinc finger BED domain-containing protein RICESLEEPER 2-like protein [Tanacetum coccineum]
MLTSKWHTLNANCQKFNAAYKRAKRLGKSGENDVDYLKRAQSIYRDEHKGVAFSQEDAWAVLRFHPKWDAPEQVDLTGDVPGATQEDLFGHDARPRPAGKPRPAKKTKSDATASTGGSSASTQFGELMEQELRLKREAAERAFEAQAEKDRTLMRLEELRFLATSTKDLDDDDAYWIKKQKQLIKNKMRNDLANLLTAASGALQFVAALAAASKTVNSLKNPHGLHAYFIITAKLESKTMDMDREICQSDDTTQVDGNQNQSVNGSQGDESQEQPFQEEDTNLIGNKRELTLDEAVEAGQVTYVNTSPRGVRDEKLRIYPNKSCSMGSKTPGGPSNLSCYSFDANISRQDLAEMIIIHEYPLVMVEHHGSSYADKCLANVLYESLCDWNIDRKISTVTVDNCTTNDAMIRDLLDKLPLSSLILGGELFHMRCCAHIVNLIVQDGLSVLGDGIDRIRDSVSYWTLTPKRVEKFEEAARHLDIPSSRTLALDCKTRWNSTYLMLEVAIIYKDVFRRLKQRDARYKSVPTERDWDLASNICKKLKLFYNVTLMFSGTKYPTMNTFFTSICDIRYELNKWRHEEDEVIKDMAEQMILKFDKYWSDIHGFMGVAAVLDPRMKLKIMKFSFPKLYHSKQRAEEEFTKLKKFVSALFIEYDQAGKANVRNHVNGVGSTSHIDESDGGFFSGYSKFIEEEEDETSDITSEVPEELDHYLKERVCNPNMKLDILAWWKINGLKYPALQTIARDILAIPISTVASESCFSTSGRLITPHRSRLKPNTLEALMCSQSWLVNEIQETSSKEFEAYDQTIEYDTDDSDEDKLLNVVFEETLVEPNMLVVNVEKFVSTEPLITSENNDPVGYALVEIMEGSDMKPSDMNDAPNLLEIEVPDKYHLLMTPLGSFPFYSLKCCIKINDFKDGERHEMWLPLDNTKTGRLHLAIKVIEGVDILFEPPSNVDASMTEFQNKNGSVKAPVVENQSSLHKTKNLMDTILGAANNMQQTIKTVIHGLLKIQTLLQPYDIQTYNLLNHITYQMRKEIVST